MGKDLAGKTPTKKNLALFFYCLFQNFHVQTVVIYNRREPHQSKKKPYTRSHRKFTILRTIINNFTRWINTLLKKWTRIVGSLQNLILILWKISFREDLVGAVRLTQGGCCNIMFSARKTYVIRLEIRMFLG